MSVTYEDRVRLTCHTCGREFSALVWLIVDASARPDLVLEDKLFTPACPHCGHIEPIDYALLLYIPNAEPPLIFSPPPGYEQSMVQDQLTELIESMREPLGRRWREEWLTEELPAVRHGLLRSLVERPRAVKRILEVEALLDEAHAAAAAYHTDGRVAHLDAAIARWDKVSTRRLLSAVSTDYRLALRNDAAEAYLLRYWAQGHPDDLQVALETWRQVVDATPTGSADLPARLSNLGIALSDLYAVTGTVSHLDEAVGAYERAVAGAADGSADLPAYLTNLGTGLSTRYERRCEHTDLERAVGAFERAVTQTPSDARERPGRLSNLGNGLTQLYELTGTGEFLSRAIEVYSAAVAAAPPNAPALAGYLGNLASALSLRFQRDGTALDLDQAVDALREALDHCPAGAPERARLLGNLGSARLDRYGLRGEAVDLDEAVIALREALAALPENAIDATTIQGNLGGGLRERYRARGDRDDLVEAVACLAQAGEKTDEDAPGMLVILDNLASALLDLYETSGDVDDLNAAIRAEERILSHVWDGSPARSGYLSHLGTSLTERYLRAGDPADLRGAVEACQLAADLCPPESPERPRYLSNLATALGHRYASTGTLDDLEDAIAWLEEAVRCATPTMPTRHAYLNNLGNALARHYDHTRDLAALERAVEAYEHALAQIAPRAPERPGYLGNLGNALLQLHERNDDLDLLDQAIAAYSAALELLEQDSPYRPGALSNLGAALTARYEHAGDADSLHAGIAVLAQCCESGRDSPALPGYLTNLGLALSQRCRSGRDDMGYQYAAKTLRTACQMGLATLPQAALDAAREWGTLALQQGAWADAAEAGGHGMQAADRLYRTQLHLRQRHLWLRDARGIAASRAYALARLGDLRTAVLTVELDRARLLSESLERDRAETEELREVAPEIHARYAAALSRLRWLASLDVARELRLPTGEPLRDALRGAYAQLEGLVGEIRALPGYGAFLAEPAWEDVTGDLSDALIYLVASTVGSVALIVWPDDQISAEWFAELTAKEIERGVIEGASQPGYLRTYEAWRRNPSDASCRQAWRDSLEETMQWLDTSLLDRVAAAVAARGLDRAYLVATGLLAVLPLHAVHANVAWAHVPNARTLALARQRLNALVQRSLLLVEDPNPTGRLALCFAGLEGAAVRAALAFIPTRHLAGSQATVPIVEEMLACHSLWHLDTHGMADWRDPLASSLLLADKERLTLRQLLTVKARAELAVLSACETAMPGPDVPDELISLAAGFLMAGAACVVSSLWAVGDLSTALLMQRFYHAFAGTSDTPGKPPAVALRMAQAWLRELSLSEARAILMDWMASPAATDEVQAALLGQFIALSLRGGTPFAHPYYWAGFQAYGAAL